jgi:hypothetical protein
VRPEDALAAATAEARRRRAAGGYVEEAGAVEPPERLTEGQLLEWALIDPDITKLRSTRRGGAPITWLKRMLLRGLQQYHNEVNYQQTRFNLQLLRKLAELEERVEKLEKER